MWRFHWKKYGGKRAGKILRDSAYSIDKWKSVLTLWVGAFAALLFIGTPLADVVMSTWQLLPLWVVPVFLLASLAYLFVRGLVKANYEEFQEASRELDKVEEKRGDLEDTLAKTRQELQALEARNAELKTELATVKGELAAVRASSRGEFSQEELTNRHLEGRDVHLADLARNDSRIRGWTFINCDIYGPAVVAAVDGTTIEDHKWIVEEADSVNWPIIPGRSYHTGVFILDGCTIKGCTFIRVGKLYVPDDESAD